MKFQKPLQVVTPTLDGDVLYVLVRANAWFTAPQITDLIGDRSTEGVRRVLLRLVEQGIVERENSGPIYRFRANRNHLAFEPVRSLAVQWETFLARLGDALSFWSDVPVYGAVFGSAARRTMGLSSDIDIFLVKNGDDQIDEWHQHVADLESRVSEWTGNDARVLWMSTSEVRVRAAEPILASVARDGIVVIGDMFWLKSRLARGEA